MAGMSLQGFTPKRFDEVVADLRSQAVPIFQDLVPVGDEVDTSDKSTIGRIVGLVAPSFTELWQAMHEVYQAFDPNSAQGVALENIVQYMGISRQTGESTVIQASVWGENMVTLPEGQSARNDDGVLFSSTSSITFNMNDILGFRITPSTVVVGSVVNFTMITTTGIYSIGHTIVEGDTVSSILDAIVLNLEDANPPELIWSRNNDVLQLELKGYFDSLVIASIENVITTSFKKRLVFASTEQGVFTTPAGGFTRIVTPVYGWESVNSELASIDGSVYEDDTALRERFRVSKAVRAGNMADSLYSQLLELADVEYVRVYENMTNAENLNGLPPHSFMALVKGGSDGDIANVVWRNKPLGIGSHGSTSVVVKDSQNIDRTVYFSRPVDVPVHVKVIVTKTDSSLPEDAVVKIRESVVSYINSLNMGTDVVYTRLYSPVNSVQGHQIDELLIGTSETALTAANINVSWNEHVFTLPQYVEVVVNA